MIVKSGNIEFNRRTIEKGKLDVFLCNEKDSKRDGLRNLDSCINPFLARTAQKRGIVIAFDAEHIRSAGRKEKAEILARTVQDLKICLKSGTKVRLINFKDKVSARSLLISLGISSSQTKEAISF